MKKIWNAYRRSIGPRLDIETGRYVITTTFALDREPDRVIDLTLDPQGARDFADQLRDYADQVEKLNDR